MKRDLLVEIIARSLGDEYYYQTGIESITFHPPTENSQLLTLTDHDKYSFTIEIKEVKGQV